jgi:uncharacterized membrane protein YesL
MGAPLHCSSCSGGSGFLENLGAWLSLSDVARSWLRLQSPTKCIPHPYHIYTKCFSILTCCGWACVCTLTLFQLFMWGWIFGKLGAWLRLSDVTRSWLRLQSPANCIPHPYHIYTKCFSTLICCGWAYVCTLTLFQLFMWGWIVGKLGAWLRLSDVARSWLRL